MKSYNVKWEEAIEASSPEEAARKAQFKIARAIAVNFKVKALKETRSSGKGIKTPEEG